MRKIIPIYALLTAFALLMSVSCNDNNSDSDEPVVVSSNTLVSAFSLAENDSVIADLDSLHFTIDVDNRLIYNADSLPKDTKINRLVANIAFYDYSSTGTIRISGAQCISHRKCRRRLLKRIPHTSERPSNESRFSILESAGTP